MNGFEFYQPKGWLSPSAASSFSRCPRHYFYNQGCGLATSEEGAALVFGGCIHRAIPYAFKGDLTKAMEVFCSGWKAELQDEKRNPMRAKAMLESFYDSHKNEKSIYNPIPSPENRLKVEEHNGEYEVPFAVDIGLDVPLVGLVDCLARHRDTNEIHVVEFKTSSQLSNMFLQAFDMSPQVLTYALAMRILLNEKIAGVFVEGLLVSKVSCSTIVVPISIKDFNLEETLSWLKSIHLRIRECESKEDFPKHFSGCNSYDMFGMPSYTCPYAPLCKTTENWVDLMSMYIIKERKETPF